MQNTKKTLKLCFNVFMLFALAAASLNAGASARAEAGVVSAGPAASPSADAATPPLAGELTSQAVTWYDGTIQYSTITNCVSIIQGLPYLEYGAGAYVGFAADPNAALPGPGMTYYIHVVIAGLGNSCAGMRAYLDVALPANTSLAISTSNPVGCYYDGAPLTPCPQSLPASTYNPGAYAIFSTDTAHANTWPIPQGHTLEFRIPVKSNTALTNAALQANIWMLDGNSSPWLRPQQGVYVFNSQPTILYPSPSTTSLAATTARSEAYLYTFGVTGAGYFDLGTTSAYGLIHDQVNISTVGTAWLVWDVWGPPALTPDTLYHWRFTFTPNGGSPIYGADQTFRTLPDGRQTVGSGTAAGCTEAAFNNALAAAGTKEILFNCGTLPVTITLTSSHSIATNLTIDGDNKVTLASNGSVNHFNVQAGAHLTLKQITLSNGNNSAACGGSINVAASGLLSLNEVRLLNNHSAAQGGALCNWGSTDITNTLFKDNGAGSMGGAIGSYATLTVANSKFTGNQAGVNGGGIDMGGTVTVSSSTFLNNHAGFRGGGINTYYGTLNVATTSFTTNTASMYGGGLANDASTTTLDRSTFSSNSSAGPGGALEISGPGELSLYNSTLSANQAATDGGGVYWNPGTPIGTANLRFYSVNSTIAANLAGAGKQGGNIYTGGAGTSNIDMYLLNTIVAGGGPNNCSGSIYSYANNLESANTCGLTGAGDKRNTDPLLGPLQNNGGPTLTRALLQGSPAIDAGDNSQCRPTDQRGVVRPIDANKDGSALCDIGAVEAPVDNTAPLVKSITLVDPNPTTAGSVRFKVTFSEPVSGVDAFDFSLVISGLTGTPAITAVAGTGSTRIVTVSTGTGIGTLKLNVIDNDSIKDLANNALGGAGAGNGNFTTGPKYTLDRNNAFISTGPLDGWVLETTETSGLGGALNAAGMLIAGDSALNQQYRSLLYFNTALLPDNATIVRVTLKIRKSGLVGTDPFTTHGLLLADLQKGIFGTLPALEALDFQAAASRLSAGSFAPVLATPGLYQLLLGSANFVYINKLGPTQFRLRFALDDNNDKGADYVTFYAGEALTASLRPLLVVEYTLP